MFVFVPLLREFINTRNRNRGQSYCFFLNYANGCTNFSGFLTKKVNFGRFKDKK